MFGLFGKKKFNVKNEKLRLISKIENVQESLKSDNLYKVNIQLDKIINRLDNEYLELTKEQVSTLDQCISTIESHANKIYESLLLNKCTHINACISSKDTAVNIMNSSIKNEDRLFEMLGQLSNIDSQIKDLDVRMNDALGSDKNLWQMFNSQRTELKNHALVLSKSYNTLLTLQNNAALANYVKEAKDFSEDIANQNAYVDIQDFNSNAEFVTSVQNDVNETANKTNESFARNFGGEDSDYAYEKALEEKYLTEAGKRSEASSEVEEH